MNSRNGKRISALERRTANLAKWQNALKGAEAEDATHIKTKIETCKKEIEILKSRIL